ncbi:hypothetical protein SAMN05216474_0177 [Lishizhenia tianjinensis]|uniref:Uncharacterized protein n=1 Tax=Lishizhenia tianjinensis TaxID=477690 RepID=A0A1I6XGV6_9FLAO|nr:hypothetical protein [Lishizhenia tianjinensis]SFT37291.1 hypothetical protein SAMN05216474_0177 [Lishizhenia tianjinensis]
MLKPIQFRASIISLAFVVLFLSCNNEIIQESKGNRNNKEALIDRKDQKVNNLAIYVEGWSCVYRIELTEEGNGKFIRGYSSTEDLGNDEFSEVYDTYSFKIGNINVLDSIHSVLKNLSVDVKVKDNSKMNDEKRMLLKYNEELRIDAYNIGGADEIHKLLELIHPYLKEDFVDLCR